MEDIVVTYLDRVLGPLIDPQKRIFLGYLASAVMIALAVHVYRNRTSWWTALARFFARTIWLSKSARADYKILLINQAAMMGIAPRLISKLVVATFLFESMHVWFAGRITLLPAAPGWVIAGLFTLVLFVLDDLSKYLVHRALHRWPLLWSFHKVHHSAETLTPFTVFRTHPVEGIIFALRSALVQATAIATFVFFFGNRTSLVTVLGANAFLFAFNLAGSNLRHSHVWISYGRVLEHWLISPAQHQIHHSLEVRHFDRNFGAVLAVWDRIGGSLCLADKANKPTAFGVPDGTQAPHDLRTIYFKPFVNTASVMLRSAKHGGLRLRKTLSSPKARWSGLAGLLFALGVVLATSPLLAS